MNEQNRVKMKLKNAEGKRLLEKTILEYSREIIKEIESNPNILTELLEELEITESDFFSHISGEVPTNITLYDQTLTLVKKKNKDNIQTRS